MIKNVPRNYSNDLDRRRQGLDSIVENLLPDVETSDAGKIMKVGEDGKWHLGSDENTIIEANPEGTASEDLENLKIGSTIYAVNKPTFEVIKGIRVTIADGGQYRTDKPKIEFYDDAGNLMTYPAYTSSCDKEYAGNISLNQVCSIATGDAPGAFTYVFSDNVVVTTYHLIKLTNAGSFAGDIAKNVKIELSSDGENFITLWEDPSISWSGTSGASRILDIKTGELSDTILPIVTSADNGKVLGVVGGVWDKTNPPTELPAVTSSDNKSYLEVNSGVWSKKTSQRFIKITVGISSLTCVDNQDGTYDYTFVFSSCHAKDINNNNLDLASGVSVDFDTIISIADIAGVMSFAYPNCRANNSFKFANLAYSSTYTPNIVTPIYGTKKSSVDHTGSIKINSFSDTGASITLTA